MTFKHKLSRRLAMLRDRALVVAILALFACVGDQPTSSLPQASVAPTTPTMLFQEPFEDTDFAGHGWYDNTAPVTTTLEHLPNSTRALEMRFPAGATTPISGGAMRRLFPATHTLYVSYWVKYSSNWVGSGRPYHPHEFYVLSDQDGDWDGPASNWLTAYIEENYQNGGIPRLALQDNKAINTSFGALPIDLSATTENRSVTGCNGIVETGIAWECFNMPPWYNDKQLQAPAVVFQPNAGAGYKATWNHVEVYFQLNSVANGKGVADGVMQYWFNGQPVIDRHDILFRTASRSTIQFHQFLIAPYIGDGSPVSQTMWVDDLQLATGTMSGDTQPGLPPPPPRPAVTDPGDVSDLAALAATDSVVTLSFTEVNDGTGQPASYEVRYAAGTLDWGSAAEVALGSCTVPVGGTTIGAKRTC